MLACNATTLVRRLWLLLSRGVTNPYPRLELVFDALMVISGTYVLASLADLTFTGRIPHWGPLDYLFVSLIVLNTALVAVCSILDGRRSPGK
jgi:hypothetical protein